MDSKQQHPVTARGSTVRVGRYELTSEIFRSEVDALWNGRATGGDDDAPVLVRRIAKKPPVSDQAFQAITEAAFSVVDVRHPRIAAVTDVVVTATEIAVVSEHTPGTLLLRVQQTAKLKQAPIPIAAALRLAVDLLDGLTASHALFLEAEMTEEQIHGAITPDFAWVTSDGEALLLDLSVALAIAADQKLARLPHFLAYRSAEKLAGTADARADVFAVGVMLWELLANRSQIPSTGRPDPRKGARPLVRLDSLTRSDAAVIEKELADLVARAVEMDPAGRFASPQEMADAIQALGADRIAATADVKTAVDRLSRPTAALRTPAPATAPRASGAPPVVSAPKTDQASVARLPPPKVPPKPAPSQSAATTKPATAADQPKADEPRAPAEASAPAAAASTITALFDDLVLPIEPAATEAPTISEVARFDSGPVAELLSSPSMKAFKAPAPPVAKPSRPRRRTALLVAGLAVVAVAIAALSFVLSTQGSPAAKAGWKETSGRNPFFRFQIFRGAPVDAGPPAADASSDATADANERSPASAPSPRTAPAQPEWQGEPGGHDKPPPKKKPFMPTAI